MSTEKGYQSDLPTFEISSEVDESLSVNESSLAQRIHRHTGALSVIGILAFLVLVSLSSSTLFPAESRTMESSDFIRTVKGLNISMINKHARKIKFSSLEESDYEDLFDSFVTHYKKAYNATERPTRYTTFKENLMTVENRNEAEESAGGTATHGVSRFLDMSNEEFEEVYLSATPMTKTTSDIGIDVDVEPYTGTADAVSWVGKYVNSINDQGYCGSCWAWSVTQQIESDSVRNSLLTTDDSLSVQEIVSCDSSSFGCRGGWTERAYTFVNSNGGLTTSGSYPYSSFYDITGICKSKSVESTITIDNYYRLGSESDMTDYVLSTGTLSVCVDASTWSTYVSGVMADCDTSVNHCVQIVGVDKTTEGGYWLVRNTWSDLWGEDGYIRLKLGVDTCGITYDPTYTDPIALAGSDSADSSSHKSKSS
jgi:C1A family cysteine protease